jgi:hypothetical protein
MHTHRWLYGLLLSGVLGLNVGCGQPPSVVQKPSGELPPPPPREALKRIGDTPPPPPQPPRP